MNKNIAWLIVVSLAMVFLLAIFPFYAIKIIASFVFGAAMGALLVSLIKRSE